MNVHKPQFAIKIIACIVIICLIPFLFSYLHKTGRLPKVVSLLYELVSSIFMLGILFLLWWMLAHSLNHPIAVKQA